MNKLFTIVERLAPETIEIMRNRYQVLKQVFYHQPIGRRQLTRNIGSTERMVRSEVDLLKSRGAIQTTAAGIFLTAYGDEMLRDFEELVPWLYNTQVLGERLKERFGLREVIIIPGDSHIDLLARDDLSRAGAEYLRRILYPGCILAVTGGTTLAGVAAMMRDGIDADNICIVPARGGLGEDVETQAGNIAAKIAQTIGAQYRLLHIPDNLEASTAEALKKDAHISEMIQTIKSANILIHGIGSATEMAQKRGLSIAEIEYLQLHDAQGEALRYYFDGHGKIIFEIPGLGLERTDFNHIGTKVAVAGGSNKAAAIEAVLRSGQENVLITDEGAAQQIIYGKDDR